MGLTIQAGTMNGMGVHQNQGTEQAEKRKDKTNFFGGNLNLANDPIAQKRKEAQEKAWSVVENAWKNDQSIDDEINARRSHYAEMEKLKSEAQDRISDIDADKSVLKELYGIEDDSREQKDLELLEKRQDIMMGLGGSLTAEEEKRLEEIDQEPLTEYQARALELNGRAGKFKLDIRDISRQMADDTADIKGIKIERLKSDPMVEAQKESEAIQKAANDEIIGMLVEEATDHIEEVQKENEEKAEEAADKKEEKEEQLDEIKEERVISEALIEGTKEAVEKAKAEERKGQSPDIELGDMMDITKSNSQSSDVQQSLEEIKNNMKLLEADLKGIKVDKEV